MFIWIAIIILLFFTLAITRLDWAILLLIASLPTYLIRFKIFSLPTTLLEIMILISFGIWFFKFFVPQIPKIIKHRKKQNYPHHWEITFLIIISFVATGISGFTNSSLGIWKAYFFEPILLYLLIFQVFKEKKELKKILWALLISSSIISLLAIFQKITGLFISSPHWAAAATRRATSFFPYPNAVGLYLAPLILVFIGWLMSLPQANDIKKWSQKIIIAITIILSLGAIYAARSEGALIGITIALFLFFILSQHKYRIISLGLLLIIIGGVFYFAPNNNSVINKLFLHDLSGQIRRQQWRETSKMLKDGRLITGAGLANYQKTISPYHQAGIFFNRDHLANFDAVVWASPTLKAKYWQPVEIYLYPHNIFLNFWTELGLFGLLLFIWLIIKYLFIALRLNLNLKWEHDKEKYLVLGLGTAMIVIFVHGLVDVPYFKNDLAIIFWLLFALLSFLDLDYQNKKMLNKDYENNSSKNNC